LGGLKDKYDVAICQPWRLVLPDKGQEKDENNIEKFG
jgi:hypothetical protein